MPLKYARKSNKGLFCFKQHFDFIYTLKVIYFNKKVCYLISDSGNNLQLQNRWELTFQNFWQFFYKLKLEAILITIKHNKNKLRWYESLDYNYPFNRRSILNVIILSFTLNHQLPVILPSPDLGHCIISTGKYWTNSSKVEWLTGHDWLQHCLVKGQNHVIIPILFVYFVLDKWQIDLWVLKYKIFHSAFCVICV